MRVPFLDLRDPETHDACLAAIARVASKNAFILGAEVADFEDELAEFCGVEHAIGVSSGTDALLAALMPVVSEGVRVLSTPFSFAASSSCVPRLGGELVWSMVDNRGLMIYAETDPVDIGKAFDAAVPVHLFGARAKLPNAKIVIEDAAQAIGLDGLASEALAATLSFHPTKILGGWGDGGAVLTNDAGYAETIRAIRNHGMGSRKYHHERIGGNFRLDAIQAAVLRVKLQRLPSYLERRREAAALYLRLLEGAGAFLPTEDGDRVWSYFVVMSDNRDKLREHLTSKGISTQIYYPEPLSSQPAFRDHDHYGSRVAANATAWGLCREALALPLWPGITSAQIEYVAEAVVEGA